MGAKTIGTILPVALAVVAGLCIAIGWVDLGTFIIGGLIVGAVIGAVVASITKEIAATPFISGFAGIAGIILHIVIRLQIWLS